MLEAFIDLFGKFAQYLKDCFCEHFLVECPPDKLQKLYLARIDIQGQQVFNICNFSRRRYVHSFPTVEYWMSIVPVLPVVRKLVGDWCCHIVQHWFSKVNAPDGNTKKDVVSSSSAWNGLHFVQALSPVSAITTTVGGKLNLATALGKMFVTGATDQPPTPPAPPSKKARINDITYQPSMNATKYLAERNVMVVGKEVATSGSFSETLIAPAELSPNDNVVLITDANDVALGYRVVKPQAAAGGGASNELVNAELAKRDVAITLLRGNVETMGKANDAALAARDTAITQLRGQLDALKTSHEAALATRDKQIAELGNKVNLLVTRTPPR